MRSIPRRTAADSPSRRTRRRPTLPLLGAVLVAALTAVAGLPIAGPAAAADIASTGGGGGKLSPLLRHRRTLRARSL